MFKDSTGGACASLFELISTQSLHKTSNKSSGPLFPEKEVSVTANIYIYLFYKNVGAGKQFTTKCISHIFSHIIIPCSLEYWCI